MKIVEVWTCQTVWNVKNFLYCVWTRNGGVRFLLKPAGYLRDRRGLFLNGAGFRLDIGGVFQLLGTQLASTCNSIIIEIYVDIIRVSHGFSRIDMLFFIAAICSLEPQVVLGISLYEISTNYRYDVNITCFWRFPKCWSIAESITLGPIIGNDHITTFFEALFLPISWRYQRNLWQLIFSDKSNLFQR